jgi:hypothetical protein
MIKKEVSFFEEHIEKIILILVGILASFLLVIFVIVSPVKIRYEQRKFYPATIDDFIKGKADDIQISIDGPPRPKEGYKPKRGEFLDLIASTVQFNNGIFPTVPDYTKSIGELPKYRIPEANGITEPASDYIRAVAYIPKTEVTEQKPYSYQNCEPNDIDLVTVEAKVDVALLNKNFKETFAGQSVKEDWRDEKLSIPVFASVNLQRQELLKDGSWSDWQDVPRARIEAERKKFEIIDDVSKLPKGGMEVRLLEYKDKNSQIELLQPITYQIATADEEWLPPTLHKKFKKIQAELKVKERAEAARIEAERARTARTSAGRGNPPGTPANIRGPGAAAGAGRNPLTAPMTTAVSTTTQNSPELQAVRDEYKKLLLTESSDLAKLKEPLLIWALDDTVKPGKEYQYRVRLGVFNPVASTDKIEDSDLSLKNKAIVWTGFIDVPDTIEVPAKVYFFAKDIQEAEKKVIVTISRYMLGYWYSSDFFVRPGDLIGKAVSLENDKDNENPDNPLFSRITSSSLKPKNVNYSTEAVVVDTLKINTWTGTSIIYNKSYFDMLYSYDGTEIEHMPVGSGNWPSQLRVLYNNIKTLEKEPRLALRSWSGGINPRTSESQPTNTGTNEQQKRQQELLKFYQQGGGR